MTVTNLEVLCPAGDFDGVKAAILNGANAVYVGCKQFSARQNATNLDMDELKLAVDFCHVRGAKLYLAVNILVFDNQLDDVANVIFDAATIGVDAIIAQDLAVISLTKKIAPALHIHASTQMAVHTKRAAQLLLDEGVSRVVLARELSLAEIAEICTVPVEIEVFVHGALCMSVSGQCYLSSMIGARSGNRGSCAGTCRMPFTAQNSKLDYDLSLKDNCLANYVDDLRTAGVASLKIEGRMKRPEYVAAAADVYSKAAVGADFDLERLEDVFSREGFTSGYLTGKIDEDMFGHRSREDVISATTKLLHELANTYKKDVPLIPLNMHLLVKTGADVCLTVHDNDGHTVTASCTPAAVAKTTPMTSDSALRSLQKLGATPFYIDQFACDIDDGLMLPAAQINALRRDATDLLELERAKVFPLVEHYKPVFQNTPQVKHETRYRFATATQVVEGLDWIIIPLEEIEHLDKINHVIIEPDRVMFGREEKIFAGLTSLFAIGYRHLLCDNLAHIAMGRAIGFTLHAGAFLNCTNSIAAHELARLGVFDITLSFETELNKANRIKSPVPLGLIVYGYLPLMIMRNCPLRAKAGCKDCGAKLTDRLGVEFKITCNNMRYAELLNSSVLYLGERLDEVKCSFVTLYFTTETKEECKRVILEHSAKTHTPATGQFTRGLYYRTV